MEIANMYDSTALALGAAGLIGCLSLSVVGAAVGTYYAAAGASSAFGARNDYSEEGEALLEQQRSPPQGGSLAAHVRVLIPIVMCGVVAIYGLIIDVILAAQMSSASFGPVDGYRGLAGAFVCGACCLASGVAIGLIGRRGAAALYHGYHVIPVVLQLVFAEALGLYGLIVALLLLSGKKS